MSVLYYVAAFTFHWKRLAHPAVIAGIVIMVIGLVLNFCSKKIADAIGKKRAAKGTEPNTQMLQMTFQFLSVGVALAGMLVAIMCINWAN